MATPTITTWIDSTGPAVHEALLLLDSQAGTRFEAEFHTAIAEANPDPEADAAWMIKIKAGDRRSAAEA